MDLKDRKEQQNG